MEEEDNDLQLQLMDNDEDATTSIAFSIDLYCHEDPLQVFTPPSMTPAAAARGGRSHNGGDAADHQQQAAVVLEQLDDDDSSLVNMMADYVARQRCYAPSRGYLDHLLGLSSSLLPEEDDDGGLSLSYARSRGVHYIVYAFGRLGLAAATAFNAVNYLDRFLAINRHLQRWETWMVELMSLACLSIACKLDEVNIPSLHQLQMEEVMSHSFRPATIRDMELTLLKALQWRIACVTPFSFLQLLVVATTSCTAAAAAASSRLLIRSLSETSLLRFDPSVIASCALRCVVLHQNNYHRKATTAADVSGAGAHISSSFFLRPEYCTLLVKTQEEREADDECFQTMKALYATLDNWSNNNHDQMMVYSDQQRSPPTSEIPFAFGIGTRLNSSAVSRRRLFGTSIPHQEDEDSIPPDTDTQEMAD